MANSKLRMIEGWIDKAGNQMQAAIDHSKRYTHYSEAIQAAQECIELAVKSILSLVDVTFTHSHGWEPDSKGFAAIAEQIQKKQLIDRLTKLSLNYDVNLPRLLFLVNFWSQFYKTAKYGLEAEYLAPAKDLFKNVDVDLALKHAKECYQAATYLRYLDKDKMEKLLSFEEAD